MVWGLASWTLGTAHWGVHAPGSNHESCYVKLTWGEGNFTTTMTGIGTVTATTAAVTETWKSPRNDDYSNLSTVSSGTLLTTDHRPLSDAHAFSWVFEGEVVCPRLPRRYSTDIGRVTFVVVPS